MKKVHFFSLIVISCIIGACLLSTGCANDGGKSKDSTSLLLMMQKENAFFPEIPQGVAQ